LIDSVLSPSLNDELQHSEHAWAMPPLGLQVQCVVAFMRCGRPRSFTRAGCPHIHCQLQVVQSCQSLSQTPFCEPSHTVSCARIDLETVYGLDVGQENRILLQSWTTPRVSAWYDCRRCRRPVLASAWRMPQTRPDPRPACRRPAALTPANMTMRENGAQ